MKLSEIYQIADKLAPKALSDEYCARYGAYDNSGRIVDTGKDVTGIVFSLDLSFAAIDKAKEAGANLIITHHPAIYGKIGEISVSETEPLGKKLVACIENGISVISMHLNLDAAEGGIDESLMDGILCSAGAGTRSNATIAVMHPLSQGGYGRVYDVPEQSLFSLAENMKREFHAERIAVYGEDKKIKRVASFCGAGVDEEAIAFAVANGANVLVSSDFKHHHITFAKETGLSVVALTHYASENYGFEKYGKKISRSVSIPCVFVTENDLL
ncbi:MAG: Nif3-like dinuclear metal center hexameric protein [Clostridia bacterium]|nr:Nif3-like dinuclear metal center hexameric protein [Clostridia bacterium]